CPLSPSRRPGLGPPSCRSPRPCAHSTPTRRRPVWRRHTQGRRSCRWRVRSPRGQPGSPRRRRQLGSPTSSASRCA
ncbi:unnamed protein product, partial [Prorocentrum cordatum]